MDELQLINQSKTLDSREVAEMMGKDHSDLLKSIQGSGKNLGIIPVLTKGNFPIVDYFIESTYKDVKGEYRKCYECTKMGCDMLGNKLQGEKGILFTAAYVKRFNIMEKELISANLDSYAIADPVKRAEKWLEEYKEKQLLEEKAIAQQETIKELEPKAKFADAISDSGNTMLIREVAKMLKQSHINMGEKRLFEFLRKKLLLVRDVLSADYNTPTQKGMELELFIIKSTVIGTSPTNLKTHRTTKVTVKGQQYILNKFLTKEWTV